MALNCGIMLRECIRHEPLAKVVLHSDHFHDFFNYVEMSTFDIASDAFATFKVRGHSLRQCHVMRSGTEYISYCRCHTTLKLVHKP